MPFGEERRCYSLVPCQQNLYGTDGKKRRSLHQEYASEVNLGGAY